MTWDAPGTYVYTISENAGDDTDIEYDGRVVTATVTVTQDDASDELVAKIAYSEDPTFVNVYKKAAAVASGTEDGGGATSKGVDPALAKASPSTSKTASKAATAVVRQQDRTLAQTGDATNGTAAVLAVLGGVALLGLATMRLAKRPE
jgi:pilin isopeptide linkage protein